MPYKLSLKAEEDILNIYREGALLFGAEQAEKYHLEMAHVLSFLPITPKPPENAMKLPHP